MTFQLVLRPGQSVQVDGIAVNFQAVLRESLFPTLVLIHGFGATLESWHDISLFLGPEFPVVRLDLRGSGFTSKPKDERYAPADQADLLIAFLNKLSLKRIVLVGHSLGGAIALLTYLKANKEVVGFKIAGLVLIDSAGYPQNLPFFIASVRNPVTRFVTYLVPPEVRARLVLQRVFKRKTQITPDRVHRYAYFLDQPGSRHALKQTARLIDPSNADTVTTQLSEVDVATLIIWGREDPVIPVEHAHRFDADIRTSKLAILEDTGHVPHEERPQRVCELIRNFVRSLE